MNIADYGTDRWGAAAAYQFLDNLEKELALLKRHPGIGRPRDEIGPGVRSWLHRGHLIFYRHGDEEVIVGRILHAAADPPSNADFEPGDE